MAYSDGQASKKVENREKLKLPKKLSHGILS